MLQIRYKLGTNGKEKACYKFSVTRFITVVGVTGFEPATSCTPSKHSYQTELHPDAINNYSIFFLICKYERALITR